MSSAGQPTVRLTPQRPEWEYHVVAIESGRLFSAPTVDVGELGEVLNRPGRDGWEPVNSLDINRHQGASSEIVLLFKRPR
jgi:hypothetical protein